MEKPKTNPQSKARTTNKVKPLHVHACVMFSFLSSTFGNEVKHSLHEKLLTICCKLHCIHENDKV